MSGETGGGQMGSHILYTPSSSAPKRGSGEEGKVPRAPQDRKGLLPWLACSLFPPLVQEAGGPLSPQDLHIHQGAPQGSGGDPCTPDRVKSPPPAASKSFLCLRTTPTPTTSSPQFWG